MHINGYAWQSYLVFGQSGTLAMVDAKGSFETVVTKVSGATVTAKNINGNGLIDLNVQASSAKIAVISYRGFTLSVD